MSSRGRIAFALLSVIWGMPYLFIKVAVDGGLSPAFLSWARVSVAAAILLGFAWRAGVLASLRGRGRWLVVYGICEIVFPFPLIAFGEQRVASSLAAILIASVPLIIAALAMRFMPAERVGGRRLIGLFVGLAGVVALMGIDVAILGAALGYSIGPMVLNRHLGDLDPRAAMGASLAVAAVVLTPLAALGTPSRTPTATAFVALAVLAVVCTATAFVVFSVLIREAGPSRASVITYINPVVAVTLGIVFLGERPGPGSVIGLLAIIGGSWLATTRRNAQPISTSTPSMLSSKLSSPAARSASGSGDS
jgi:drug/metabolite transporter (DMT)-like permease